MRTYRSFTHKDAAFRICCSAFEVVTSEIVRQRDLLEQYMDGHREFASSFKPVTVHERAPEVARRMAAAARRVGVGPMAAVAGAMAQLAAEAGLAAGAEEAIVENGGDLYVCAPRTVVVGLYAGETPIADRLALAVDPREMPIAICSSSSHMGHSISLGDCDLATVVADDASLADAAATEAANRVKRVEDLDRTLDAVGRMEGIRGLLLIKGDKIGLIGALPKLVRNADVDLVAKVTRHAASGPDYLPQRH
jgi:ApbE superfamily uncharacterized protein (UPF0280 family)